MPRLRRIVGCWIVLSLVVVLGNGSGRLHADEENTPMKSSEEVRQVAHSGNEFAFHLYGQLRTTHSGNLFFSPTSISTALAMTYAGAEGETEKEMADVLNFSLPETETHAAFAELTDIFNAAEDSPYELRVANRLWGQTGYGFLPEFLAVTRKQYGAELAQVDFINETEQTRREINAWIARQTNDKIKDLIPRGAIDTLTRLVLTNAVYFQGTWEHTFDKRSTRDAPFTTAGGEKVDVPLMYQKEHFSYAKVDDLQVLEMPYKGDDLSMLILLPAEADGLAALEEKLTTKNLKAWTDSMRRKEVRTYVPRFQFTEQFMLNSPLAALGMTRAFNAQKADFSGMNGKRNLYITAAVHKAFVDVNEEGTEAAAATGIVVGATAAPIDPIIFRADHPFVFMIRDGRTGSILFLGRVVNPKE